MHGRERGNWQSLEAVDDLEPLLERLAGARRRQSLEAVDIGAAREHPPLCTDQEGSGVRALYFLDRARKCRGKRLTEQIQRRVIDDDRCQGPVALDPDG